MASQLTEMSFFVVSTDLGCQIFTNANEKLICTFSRFSQKQMPCNSDPNFMLFALALQIVLV